MSQKKLVGVRKHRAKFLLRKEKKTDPLRKFSFTQLL
jgi:hypothetical protein